MPQTSKFPASGEIEIILSRPHSSQYSLLKEARRFNVAVCGRRFGKSTLAVNLLCETALNGKHAAYFAPTYKYTTPTWREIKRILAPVIAHKDEQERRIELITGGSIEFWSLDKDVARGRKYHLVVIDEASLVAFLETAWNEAIRPTLADYLGCAWFLFTPKGLNYAKTIFDYGQDPFKLDWQSWQLPTSANPYIAPSEIEAMKEELPEDVFRQEVLAEFLEGQGSVFRKVRAAATIPHALDPYPGTFVAGLDFAQKSDFTVLTVWDKSARRMVDLDRFNKIEWKYQRNRIKNMSDKWQLSTILAEENSIGGPNIEALRGEGLPIEAFQTTATSKPPLIQSLSLAFEKGELEIINDPVLISELEAFEATVNRTTGRTSYNAPVGRHDDCVIAAALGWKAVLDEPPKRKKLQVFR